jgi:hypothetical protein
MKIQNYYRRTSRELKRLASIARSPMYLSGEHLAHFSEEEDLNWVVAPFSDLEWVVALLSGPVCFLNNHDRNRYDWFSCTLDGLSTIRAHEMVSKNGLFEPFIYKTNILPNQDRLGSNVG